MSSGKITDISAEWLTMPAAARLVGVTRQAVEAQASNGRIRRLVLGPRHIFVSRKDVERWKAEGGQAGRPRGGTPSAPPKGRIIRKRKRGGGGDGEK